MDLTTMSAEEVLAEAKRRTARQEKGLPLTDDTAGAPPGARKAPMRSEKEEHLDCDRLVIREGGARVNFSQARESEQTLGIPDARYRLGGIAFWWEVKRADGKLSKEQDEYLRAELACNCLGGAGTADDLEPIVRAIANGDTLRLVTDLLAASVERVRERGPR